MFAEYIKEKRIEAGLSLGELAKRSGISKATIANWNRGIEPSAENLHKALVALNESVLVGKESIFEKRKEEPK